jgi:hypothetical protein
MKHNLAALTCCHDQRRYQNAPLTRGETRLASRHKTSGAFRSAAQHAEADGGPST